MPFWGWCFLGDGVSLAMMTLWQWCLFGDDASLRMMLLWWWYLWQWCLFDHDASLAMMPLWWWHDVSLMMTWCLFVDEASLVIWWFLALMNSKPSGSNWSNKTVKRCCPEFYICKSQSNSSGVAAACWGNRLWFFCKWGVNWIHFVFSKHLSKRQGSRELRVTKQSRGVVIAEEL